VNGSIDVNPNIRQITLNFSEEMNIEHRGFDYGPLGESNVLSVMNVVGFSADHKSFTFDVELKADSHYQSLVTNRFMSKSGVPLEPFLIDIKTSH
jgi:hypothetical protein